ncbi:MAG: hypothetical protein ACO3FE_03420 [Planctomycetaceae bacterium]|jgi:hypothetical protein
MSAQQNFSFFPLPQGQSEYGSFAIEAPLFDCIGYEQSQTISNNAGPAIGSTLAVVQILHQ